MKFSILLFCSNIFSILANPTFSPSISPTAKTTFRPSINPSLNPTLNPSLNPSLRPTLLPTNTNPILSLTPFTSYSTSLPTSNKVSKHNNNILYYTIIPCVIGSLILALIAFMANKFKCLEFITDKFRAYRSPVVSPETDIVVG